MAVPRQILSIEPKAEKESKLVAQLEALTKKVEELKNGGNEDSSGRGSSRGGRGRGQFEGNCYNTPRWPPRQYYGPPPPSSRSAPAQWQDLVRRCPLLSAVDQEDF